MVYKILFFIGLFFLFLHPIESGDFFHHLNSGKYVVTHLSLPYNDDLSFTANGKPWVAYGWGSGVVFYLIYSTLGSVGISVLFASLGVLASLFLFLSLKKLEVPDVLTYAITFASSALLSLRWPARPEVIGPLFVIALIYLLLKFKKPNKLFPLFFWIWSLSYGASTFLGIGIFAFYLLSSRIFDRKSWLILGLSFIASLSNGYGFSSFLYIFQIPKIAPHVGEWLPLIKTLDKNQPTLVLFYQFIVLFFLIFLTFYTITIFYAAIKFKKVLRKQLFLLIVSLAILSPFYTNRFVNLAALVSVPIIGIIISQLNSKYRKLVLVFLIIFGVSTSYVRFTRYVFGVGLSASPFQTRVTSFMRANNINGNIYSTQEIGSFLSWELPESKVFVDTRDDLYSVNTTIFDELGNVSTGKQPLESLLNKYNANIVVGDISAAQNYRELLYSPNWKLVYITDGYFLLLKTDTYLGLKSIDFVDLLKDPPVKEGKILETEAELSNSGGIDSTSLENQVRMIEVKLKLGKNEEAKDIVEKLQLTKMTLPYQPGIVISNYELTGKVHLAAKNCDSAFNELTQAEKLSYGQLMFFPEARLDTSVDKYLGDYFQICKNDKNMALKYYNMYLVGPLRVIERREIERKINSLNEHQ